MKETSRFPLDYRLLQALDAVVREQHFERAANSLHLTQSAISQRIKQLEQQVAQPLLIRSNPPKATRLGEQLLCHYRQISQLERELYPLLAGESDNTPLKVSIAVNADTLATWFIPAVSPILAKFPVELNLVVDDETRTLEKLRQGEVFAAVSCQSTQLPGCHCTPLCSMEYALVCAPGFHARYFSQGLTREALVSAPGVAFDQRDDMHMSYIQQEFALEPGSYPCHTVRSSEAFIALAKAGVAYCLIPVWQIADELATGCLQRLPAPPLYRHLFWHRWILERGIYKQLSEAVIAHCQTLATR
jgi:transcriptional regulator, ArgP family